MSMDRTLKFALASVKSHHELVTKPMIRWWVANAILNTKLARANFKVLSIDIPLAHYAIGDDLNNHFHIVGAVLVKPFHNSSEYAG